MAHQIIDNRNKKLADEINQQLGYTSKAKIAAVLPKIICSEVF